MTCTLIVHACISELFMTLSLSQLEVVNFSKLRNLSYLCAVGFILIQIMASSGQLFAENNNLIPNILDGPWKQAKVRIEG